MLAPGGYPEGGLVVGSAPDMTTTTIVTTVGRTRTRGRSYSDPPTLSVGAAHYGRFSSSGAAQVNRRMARGWRWDDPGSPRDDGEGGDEDDDDDDEDELGEGGEREGLE